MTSVNRSWHYKKEILSPDIDFQNQVLEAKRKALMKLVHAKRAPNARVGNPAKNMQEIEDMKTSFENACTD